MAQELKLEPNKPKRIALKYAGPKFIRGRGDHIRAMFTLEDSRVFFCDLELADQIKRLARPGEQFWIQLKWSGKPGNAADWDLWLDSSAEWTRAKKTEPVPEVKPAPLTVSDSRENHPTASVSDFTKPENGSQEESWARYLRRTTTVLTDVYAECVKEARKHGETVNREDVRTMLVTAFIAATRGRKKARRAA